MSKLFAFCPGPRRSALSLLGTGLLVVGLGGCAGYDHFTEGKRLLQDNRVEEGLEKLQQAVAKNPSNNEYKVVYRSAKERAVQSLLR
jgi:general secretion pathway protein D